MDKQGFSVVDVGKIRNGLSYGIIEAGPGEDSKIVLRDSFYFVLVINGTAFLSDSNRNYKITRGDLLVLTPSMTVTLDKIEADCILHCVCLSPGYFDTLYDGQPAYNQLAAFFHEGSLPITHVASPFFDYLLHTVSLFTEPLGDFVLNEEGILRHLCSFYLLQIANALYGSRDKDAPVCVKRSSEIYRHFKKLLVEHYRTRHDIAFYAGQLHITPTYLSRTVKAVTGRTIHSIITELIYADAIKYLECTDMDIKEIAEILGFSDQSAFGKFFLKKAHLSPLKFRLRK